MDVQVQESPSQQGRRKSNDYEKIIKLMDEANDQEILLVQQTNEY